MKLGRLLFLISAIFLLTSCAGMHQSGNDNLSGFLSINATVQEIKGNNLIVTLKLPETKVAYGSPIGEITQQIVHKSLLLEGMKTEVGGKTLTIRELRGNTALMETENSADYKPGKIISITVPKKTLAIVDFEVIKGTEREAGRVTMEGLTSALIDSGQFTVLERSKLKAIMNELELSLSGLAKESHDKAAGKLLIADLILTGTLSENITGEWDINLRLVNVRTGQAISAVALKTSLIKPSELRDAGPWNENFESSSIDPSWKIGYKKRRQTGEFERISIDRQSGSDNSKKSLRIDFKFADVDDQWPFYASAENSKKRNLSLYNGIEFYVRGSEKLYGQLNMLTSVPENINKIDNWVGFFEIDTKWERCRIPFDKMVPARRWIKQGAAKYGATPGDQIMRLHRVEAFRIGVDNQKNPATEGAVWIDNIRFYRD
ncbi:MAG: CsgG/HfaB family protein [Smithella sp.]